MPIDPRATSATHPAPSADAASGADKGGRVWDVISTNVWLSGTESVWVSVRPDGTVTKTDQFAPSYPGATGAIYQERDGTIASDGEHSPVSLPWYADPFRDVRAGRLKGERVPDTLVALLVRHSALEGQREYIDRFASRHLHVPYGDRWRRAVSTALLGDWVSPLRGEGLRIDDSALAALRAEARAIHRQLMPMWHRKVSGQRLWSLDADFGDGITAYDVLTGGPDPIELLSGALHDNPRIADVLRQLTPIEQAVAVAYADTRSMPTWTEAAITAASMAPDQFEAMDLAALGERVRKKLKRLGALHISRDQAAAVTREGRQQ